MTSRSVCLTWMVALLFGLCAVAQYVGPIVPGTAVNGTVGSGTVRKGASSSGTVRKSTTAPGTVRKATSGYGNNRKSTSETGKSRKTATDSGNSRKSTTGKDSKRQQTTTKDKQNGQPYENKQEKTTEDRKTIRKERQTNQATKEPQKSRDTITWGPNSDYHPDVRNWPLQKRRMRKVVTGMTFGTGGVTVLPHPGSGSSSQNSQDSILDGILPSVDNAKTAVYVTIQGIFDGKGMFVFNGRELSYVAMEGALPQEVMVNDELWPDVTVPLKLNRNYAARSSCRVTKATGRGTVQAMKDEHTYAVSVDDSPFEGGQPYSFVVRFE